VITNTNFNLVSEVLRRSEKRRLEAITGFVSKRLDAPYRTGPSKSWLKSKNPLSEAVRREREERLRRDSRA
jgi:ATP-dependent DNA ligase